jgi:hypothetical protein
MANTEEILRLVVDRLEQDWHAAPVGVRKSPTLAELAMLQARCAAFIINVEGLRHMVSEELFTQELPKLCKKFNAKYPTKAIEAQTLISSIKGKLEKSAQTDHGLYIDPKLQYLFTDTYIQKLTQKDAAAPAQIDYKALAKEHGGELVEQ